MKKGKFGLGTPVIAAIAFGFCALQQPQSVLLVAGFALLAERDSWLNRQVLQALFLIVTYYVANLAVNWVFIRGFAKLFEISEIYRAQNATIKTGSYIGDLLDIALIVFSIIAIVKILRGKDAGLPFISKLAGYEGISVTQPMAQQPTRPTPPVASPPQSRPEPVPAPQVIPQQPQPVPAPQAVQQQPQPAPAPQAVQQQPAPQIPTPQSEPASEAQSPKFCSTCGAPIEADSLFCTKCGTKL